MSCRTHTVVMGLIWEFYVFNVFPSHKLKLKMGPLALSESAREIQIRNLTEWWGWAQK